MIERLLKWLRNYFGFNKTETYGVLVIHALIMAGLVGPIILEYYLDRNQVVDLPQLTSVSKDSTVSHAEPVAKDSLFSFDPNVASKEEFITLGLPEYLAKRIINFRSKGGSFKSSNDLYVIYGIDSLWVLRVMDSITIAKQTLPQNSYKIKPSVKALDNSKVSTSNKKSSPKLVDINHADTTDLKSIRGIGKVLSTRIIKFRDNLGGFHKMDQLIEVYGLSEEVIDLLRQRFYIEKSYQPTKISINSCTLEILQNHPYLTRRHAELIVNYRANHFPLTRDDLGKIPSITPEQIGKLLPYLSFQ